MSENKSRLVTFHRRVIQNALLPDWMALSNTGISGSVLVNNGKIEDINDVAHVDFANKCIGGGVLGRVKKKPPQSIVFESLLITRLIRELYKKKSCF